MTEQELQQRIPVIERLARRVANRKNASCGVREELLADAVAHIWMKIDAYDSAKGSFEQWTYVVLRNHCVSMIREEAKRWKIAKGVRANAEREQDERLRAEPVVAEVMAVEEEARRPQIDVVEKLGRLPHAIDRILLATYSGLLENCGRDVIVRWCREAGIENVAAIHEIGAMPQAKRKKALATFTGHTNDWVRQRIFRAVQSLRGDDPAGGRA